MSEDSNYLADLGERVYAVNVANGWFEDDRRFGEDIALLHSEVSEALEAYRDWGLRDHLKFPHGSFPADDLGEKSLDFLAEGYKPKPEGVASELADILIRLVDTAKRAGIDLHAATELKLEFNKTRGYKHGGKAL